MSNVAKIDLQVTNITELDLLVARARETITSDDASAGLLIYVGRVMDSTFTSGEREGDLREETAGQEMRENRGIFPNWQSWSNWTQWQSWGNWANIGELR